ncbi:type II Golgi membrane protein [Scheffersomyces coipomensis]|uniref:type II Golgi membrane protein n=1 Tax=Scheffersomyces coipomensis TaxID=1788519 RepID=UPI00315C9DA2
MDATSEPILPPKLSSPNYHSNSETASHRFWTKIFQVLEECKVDDFGEGLYKMIDYTSESIKGNTKEALLSKAFIGQKSLEELKLKHQMVLQRLPSEIPSYAYKKGTKGIVMIGGGRFSWLSYLSLIGLRETGSLLPVEILLPSPNDYENEKDFCDTILPPMNAKCVLLSESLGETVYSEWNKKFANYQFKALSLIASSFEHVLLLDSDNIVLSNPDTIFGSSLYKHYGMITWPDYWSRTISPKFYEIAGVDINESHRVRYNRFPLNVASRAEPNLSGSKNKGDVPYHDLEGAIPDLSTESGQFFVNKGTHGKTLLLALYYNIYGPDLYYKLMSLGEQGEGDKDTFVAAAIVVKQKYYQLKSFIKTIGYIDSNSQFQGVAMGQMNPLKDNELFEEVVIKPLFDEQSKPLDIDQQIEYLEKVKEESFSQNNQVPIFAVHCNYPKLDPLQLLARDDLFDKEKQRLKYRLYSSFSYDLTIGSKSSKIDFELNQWIHMRKVICEQKIHFVHFQDADLNELCRVIENQITWLTSSTFKSN